MSAEAGVARTLDLLTLGRSSVDLYGEQIGGRLEDMASFAKYVGGSPTNTAIGAARLGLAAGLVTRVGDDHMGRFICEQLVREGVDVAGVRTDPERLTALAMLGIRDRERFPLVFFRENCADMALAVGDIDAGLIARAGALLINGTHLSHAGVRAASMRAAELMKARGGRLVFDIDYRPVLWGLAGKANGEDRFVASQKVTDELTAVLPLCDLVVGTEEEVHILAGTTDTLAALRRIRERTSALIVLKLGADGCVAFKNAIPSSIGQGVIGRGFPVEVFNILGAGDAFMAGFLRGWLRDEPLGTCCTWANACGALVVSRHGCAPAEPTWDELQLFLSRADWPRSLRESVELEQLHWSTTRGADHSTLNVLAIDHRSQFDDLVAEAGIPDAGRVPAFKELAMQAIERVAGGRAGFGLLADGRYGMRALERAADHPYWIGRPIEFPGSRPLRFEGASDPAVTLREWPLDHVVKCLVFYHPDDPSELRAAQDEQIVRLFEACRATRHELLLEIIASKHGAVGPDTVARVVDHVYDLGVYPDWWKLEPATDAEEWAVTASTIERRDPRCRGIVLLGLSASAEALLASFEAVAATPLVRGFAVGRTIWHDVAADWLAGVIDDERAVERLATNYGTLVDGWRQSRRETAAAS